MSKAKLLHDSASELTKRLVDNGRLLEAGFAAFATYVIPKDALPIQINEMRLAYMAGAEHVWSSIMNVLDPGEEPTADDMRRMELVQREIDEWRAKLSDRVDPPQGRA